MNDYKIYRNLDTDYTFASVIKYIAHKDHKPLPEYIKLCDEFRKTHMTARAIRVGQVNGVWKLDKYYDIRKCTWIAA